MASENKKLEKIKMTNNAELIEEMLNEKLCRLHILRKGEISYKKNVH